MTVGVNPAVVSEVLVGDTVSVGGAGVSVKKSVELNAISDGMAVPAIPPAESVPTRAQSMGRNVPYVQGL